ncbi:outer membrane lipid asymmetry maintenance protein MlaD [Siccirubricoccus sp. KC 17139]|uniref:Outer membrane lipid asymmetry maintenance protein MlaD n=1 Tax=Siccirubricoccus soli TaxID=2899147 RepID=A0ABT1D4Z5_9PROT|nr:outer membrane lipid asymmetry maintenance protein MlaD [Siccirubricoccus soli]MCO6416279.1 outer membrane lipid asymmetry maintenance protein MlaD [Siccirubricoccus soli]MCP2682413.1 outer membrane lipid asymmetry maintenance protein MlaD [Siccirubricoccus soli]
MQGRSLAEVLTGAVVLLVAAAFLAYAVLHSGRGTVVAEGMQLRARFDRIDGLSNGADVRIAGVKVGTVTDSRIDPQTFGADLTLRIDRSLRLPDDTSAEITSEGLLGGKYVSLVPGGSEKILADGGRITETQGSVSLESLLGRFIFSVTQMNSANSQQQQQQGTPATGSGGGAPR